jgi:acetylornithine/N-succinyldiaminopimelate aminotransferase
LLLVFDEVQTGVGRTGSLFAYQASGIAPDIMAVAKGIGGGFPLGACLATEEAAKGMTAGSHGSTFGGNPLAMAVGNAVLDVVLEPGFLEHVRTMALALKQRLAAVIDGFPDILESVRGEGLMLGVKCKVPNSEVANACIDNGLLVVPAGDNVIRLLPPLTITTKEVGEAMNRFEMACGQVRNACVAS